MKYVISDVHGRYDLFIKMLDKISFSDNDTLYLLGDMSDRGPDGIKLLQDVMNRPNVIPFLGNHEEIFYRVIRKIGKSIDLNKALGRATVSAARGINITRRRCFMNDQINVIFRDWRDWPNPEKKLLKVVIPNAEAELKEKCRICLDEIYGGNPPREAVNRMERELYMETGRGFAPHFLFAAKLAKRCDFVGGVHWVRDCAGNSFLSFLLGIAETNPLPPHKYCRSCGYTEFDDTSVYASGYDIDCSKRERALCPRCGSELVGDGHNMDDTFFLGEWGDFAPSFSIDVPEETHHQMLSWLAAQGKIQECASPKEIDAAEPAGLCLDLIGDRSLSALRELEKRTGAAIHEIRCEEILIPALIEQMEPTPFLCWEDLALLQKLRPSCFSDVVKAYGLGHGTGTWIGNAEDLIDTVGSKRNLIAHRDDILETMLQYGVDRRTAVKLSHATRKGRAKKALTPELTTMLLENGVPAWYLESMRKIQYLFPRAHSIEYLRVLFRLAWYGQHFPYDYSEVIQKAAEKEKEEHAELEKWIQKNKQQ